MYAIAFDIIVAANRSGLPFVPDLVFRVLSRARADDYSVFHEGVPDLVEN